MDKLLPDYKVEVALPEKETSLSRKVSIPLSLTRLKPDVNGTVAVLLVPQVYFELTDFSGKAS